MEFDKDGIEDTIEHLYRLKTIACKAIKKLEEYSELYDHGDDEDEVKETRTRGGRYKY